MSFQLQELVFARMVRQVPGRRLIALRRLDGSLHL